MPDIVRAIVTTVWADGGQRVARRNAWAAMAADAQRARQRAEAMAVLDAVAAVHGMSEPMAASASHR
jgi:hypothetical protein